MAGSSSFAEPLHDYTYRPYNQEIIFIDWGSRGMKYKYRQSMTDRGDGPEVYLVFW
jgi:hypothetical protein